MILEYCAHFINVNILRKIKYGIKKMSIYTTTIPTTFNKWQKSPEKSQAHNLKVAGSNLTPRNQLI